MSAVGRPLVEVRDLHTHFPVRRGLLRRVVGAVRAVDGISFDLQQGDALALVGESGSGKSTTARTLLSLTDATSGTVTFDGEVLTDASGDAIRRRRRDMQMIFQDPYASLNPRHTVARIVREPLDIHGIGGREERAARVSELLELVGLDPSHGERYPHELSGGQRQRVGVARALATSPRLVVADEPISALDMSIQAQIVNLLDDLRRELDLTYLVIAHDLAMVRHLSDRVAVMYLGKIVEIGPTDAVFARPLHPYTRALLAAIPRPDPDRARARSGTPPLIGEVPSPTSPPPGCRFHPRCPFATEVCRSTEPEERAPSADGHVVSCHHAEQLGPSTPPPGASS